jgi:hypothetical protein
MWKVLNEIRQPVTASKAKKVMFTAIVFASGIALGIISKVLDETPGNTLPYLIEMLDLRNFFSRIGFWIFSGICVAIYSKSVKQAALNSFLFFVGMVGSYYAYTIIFAGFFPKSYMMIWIAMTAAAPFLGAICWFAKGTHIVSICISAIILAVMTRQAFNFGFWYFDVSHQLELMLWGVTILVLYKKPKQILLVICLGVVLFFLTSQFHFLGGMI